MSSDLFEGTPTVEELQDLIKEKDQIELDIEKTKKWLYNSGYGLSGGLIDDEGYPISDIEKIMDVRSARNKLATLRTDHTNLMKRIEVGLELIHLATRHLYTKDETEGENPMD